MPQILENALLDCVCEPCTGDLQNLHGARPHAGIGQLNDSAALLSTVLHVFLALCWAWPGAVPLSRVAAVWQPPATLSRETSSNSASSTFSFPLATPRSSRL